MILKNDTLAPDFTLLDETGKPQRLSDYRGKTVLLYFYPKDDTPGCTTEACSFLDNYSAYQNAGVTILGVSPDSPKSHAKFKEKYHLPFTLLSDESTDTIQAFGVWGKKKFLGKEFTGILRTSFLIDPKGKVVKVYENVKPNEHAEQILKDFAEEKKQ